MKQQRRGLFVLLLFLFLALAFLRWRTNRGDLSTGVSTRPVNAMGSKTMVTGEKIAIPKMAPVAPASGKSGPLKNDLGKIDFGVGKQHFTLRSGRTVSIDVVPQPTGAHDLHGKAIPDGSAYIEVDAPGWGAYGAFSELGKPFTVKFGDEDLTFVPQAQDDPNNFGAVDLSGKIPRTFLLGSGRMITVTLREDDPDNPAYIGEFKDYRDLGIDYKGGSMGSSLELGVPFRGELPDGEAFVFTAKKP